MHSISLFCRNEASPVSSSHPPHRRRRRRSQSRSPSRYHSCFPSCSCRRRPPPPPLPLLLLLLDPIHARLAVVVAVNMAAIDPARGTLERLAVFALHSALEIPVKESLAYVAKNQRTSFWDSPLLVGIARETSQGTGVDIVVPRKHHVSPPASGALFVHRHAPHKVVNMHFSFLFFLKKKRAKKLL